MICSYQLSLIINNNNNLKTMFMVLSLWQKSHCESSLGSFNECRTAPSGRRRKTKPDDLGCESACTGCHSLHPPSPFIIIAQPQSWYSFYCLTDGRRLSRPSWLTSGNIPRWFTRPQTVTHPATNWVWSSATTLIKANALPCTKPNHQTVTSHWRPLTGD